jgi:hypothetical protein
MGKKWLYIVAILVAVTAVGPVAAQDLGRGNILFEEWFGGGINNDLDTLKAHPDFQMGVAHDSYWAQEFVRPDGGEDYWGARARGFLYPPQTGEYTFWIYSDDDGELHLSTDEDPANTTQIAGVEGWTNVNEWGKYPSQESEPISLVAGKRYYIEALVSDGTGGGHLGVGWGGPGIGEGPIIIDGQYLAPILRDPEPLFQATNPSPTDGETGVLVPLVQWEASSTAQWHDLYLGTSPDLGPDDFIARQLLPVTLYYHFLGFEPGTTYYWRVDEVEKDATTIHEGQVWSFTTAPVTAWDPLPGDGGNFIDPNAVLTWKAGTGATGHEVYFGTDRDAVANRDPSVFQGRQVVPLIAMGILDSDATYYWLVDEVVGGAIVEGSVWSFTTRGVIPKLDPTLVGWWKMEDEGAGKAIDYSGWDHDGLFEGDPQWVDGFQGDGLELDGIGDYVTVGSVGISGADARTIAGWVKASRTGIAAWTNVFGFTGPNANGQQFDIECVGDTSTTTLGYYGLHIHGWEQDLIPIDLEWHHLAATYDGSTATWYADGQQIGTAAATIDTPDDVQMGKRQVGNLTFPGVLDDIRVYSRVLALDDIAQVMRGDTTLAGNPQPARGSLVDMRGATSLSWTKGDTAAQHDVYFGQDRDAVKQANTDSPEYMGRQAGTNYSLAALVEFGGGTYYWRIDEVEAGGATIHEGSVWSFTIPDYLIVDLFESYSNQVGQRVFQTWVDGLGFSEPAPGNPGNGTGALVGHDIWTPSSPHYNGKIIEVSKVHGGAKAMPLYYNNDAMPWYSETERVWAVPQDFAAFDVDTLELYVSGDSANAADQLYVGLEDSMGRVKIVSYLNSPALTSGAWTRLAIPLSDFTAAGVNVSAIKKMYIGVGNRGAGTPGGTGMLLVDDIIVIKELAGG